MSTYKLMVETPQQDIDYIIEEQNSGESQTLFIEGPFLMANEKNRNNRVYALEKMVTEVDRYTNEMIKPFRSLGELNHPTSVEVNPERACHIVSELRRDGNIWIGKSRVLTEMPMGKIVSSLIKDKVKLGVSSRALGDTVNEGHCTKVNDFKLIAIDVVHDPSVNTAFVNGILESKQWVLDEHGYVEAAYSSLESNISSLPRHSDDRATLFANEVKRFISSL